MRVKLQRDMPWSIPIAPSDFLSYPTDSFGNLRIGKSLDVSNHPVFVIKG
jgi:hypothetical protein